MGWPTIQASWILHLGEGLWRVNECYVLNERISVYRSSGCSGSTIHLASSSGDFAMLWAWITSMGLVAVTLTYIPRTVLSIPFKQKQNIWWAYIGPLSLGANEWHQASANLWSRCRQCVLKIRLHSTHRRRKLASQKSSVFKMQKVWTWLVSLMHFGVKNTSTIVGITWVDQQFKHLETPFQRRPVEG